MAKLTPTEIAVVVMLETGTRNRDVLTTAVAISLAESNGGDPNAHNPKPPDDSYGLWQINMLGDMGPERRRRWGLKSNRELFQPFINARAMWDLSGQGTKWCAWSVYKTSCGRGYTGAYASKLDAARAGVDAALRLGAKEAFELGNSAEDKAEAGGAPKAEGGGSLGGGVSVGGVSVGGELPGGPEILGGLEAIGAFFSTLSEGQTWIRVLWVVAGLVLIVIAAVLLGLDLWKG